MGELVKASYVSVADTVSVGINKLKPAVYFSYHGKIACHYEQIVGTAYYPYGFKPVKMLRPLFKGQYVCLYLIA